MIRALLVFLGRVAYTAPVLCAACREDFYPMFGEPMICKPCARTLADPKSRTTTKPPRQWPVEAPAVRSIRRGKR